MNQTEWDNNESLSSLTTNSIVQLSGDLDLADATIDADDISILSQDGFYATGLLTYVNPSSGPASSFDLYVRGLLPTTTGLTLGQIAQVDLSGNENFFIHRMHDPLTEYLFSSSTGTFQIQVNDFAGLLIPETVTVYTDSNTSFRSTPTALSSVTCGENVRVVGLFLKDPSSGNAILLARYVDALN